MRSKVVILMNTNRGLNFRENAPTKKENPEILEAKKTSILNVIDMVQIFKKIKSIGVSHFTR